ncbi:MAG: integration host factor, actinobacterial type [Bacillota bacterium]|nr:integration host factor, actinobacterial type [Bacillota bacterium]
MKLPVLTLSEKKEALEKAQKMRSERKEIREQLKTGRMVLSEVLSRDNDEVMGKMRVAYLLASLPRVGKTTAKKVMDEIGIDESRRVQGLGKRQKEALLARFSRK